MRSNLHPLSEMPRNVNDMKAFSKLSMPLWKGEDSITPGRTFFRLLKLPCDHYYFVPGPYNISSVY